MNDFFSLSHERSKKKEKKVNRNFEDPMVYIFRRIYKLPEKTMNLVKNPGHRRYYLDIIRDNNLQEESFKFLIMKVCNGANLALEDYEKIGEYFDRISFKYSPIMFEGGKNPYLNPLFSEKIKEILLFGTF